MKSRMNLVVKANLHFASDPLPEGVIGRIIGIAVPYETPDESLDVFARGCFERTQKERVTAGKVKLFAALESHAHSYGINNHVGYVTNLYDDGNNCMVVADLLDTTEGRAVHEYLKAVVGAGTQTGLSVGVRVIVADTGIYQGQKCRVFKECRLEEITITPMPAYEGTGVVAVKSEGTDPIKASIRQLLEMLGSEERSQFIQELAVEAAPASDDTTPPAEPAPVYMSYADRLRVMANHRLFVG